MASNNCDGGGVTEGTLRLPAKAYQQQKQSKKFMSRNRAARTNNGGAVDQVYYVGGHGGNIGYSGEDGAGYATGLHQQKAQKPIDVVGDNDDDSFVILNINSVYDQETGEGAASPFETYKQQVKISDREYDPPYQRAGIKRIYSNQQTTATAAGSVISISRGPEKSPSINLKDNDYLTHSSESFDDDSDDAVETSFEETKSSIMMIPQSAILKKEHAGSGIKCPISIDQQT